MVSEMIHYQYQDDPDEVWYPYPIQPQHFPYRFDHYRWKIDNEEFDEDGPAFRRAHSGRHVFLALQGFDVSVRPTPLFDLSVGSKDGDHAIRMKLSRVRS